MLEGKFDPDTGMNSDGMGKPSATRQRRASGQTHGAVAG